MHEALDPKTLAELTTEIVAAYVAHHAAATAEIPALIDAVAKRLARLASVAEEAAAPPVKPEPAVPVRRSVAPEHLVCLACGKKVRTLKRHLSVAHGLMPAAYRAAFGLPRDYPLTAPAYAERRAEIARRIGLGSPGPAPEPAAPMAPSHSRRRAKTRAEEAAPA